MARGETGEVLFAHEVERVIAGHPEVRQAVVVAVPGPVFVEEACAVAAWPGALPKLGCTARR